MRILLRCNFKNMIKKILLFILLTYCAYSYAGAWVQEKGHWLNILGIAHYTSTQFWDSNGHLQTSPTYTKNEIAEYFEYGLTEKITLGAYLNALRSHTLAAGTQAGSNDNLIFGRFLLWKSDWSALSTQLYVDKLGRAVEFNIPPSNSRFNTGEALLFGTGGKIGKEVNQYWFFGSLLGFIQRYSAGNLLQLNFEGGIKVRNDSVLIMLQNYNTLSVAHLSAPNGTEYNLVTLAPSIVYWLTNNLGVQLGLTQDVYGQNVGKGRAAFTAMWLRA